MSLGITVLGSGSTGNSIVIHTENNGLLIDAGFSNKELLTRLEMSGLSPEIIKALIITHEHTDHTKGARVFADKKGIITITKEGVDEDNLMEAALDAGASDIENQEDAFEVISEPADLDNLRQTLETASFPIIEAEVRRIPQNTVKLDAKTAESFMKLLDALEELDDIQKISANFDIDDDVMEQLSAG